MPDPNGFLMQFDDGPLAKRTGMNSLVGSAMGVLNVPAVDFSWPLPRILAVAVDGGNVAIWDALAGTPPLGATALCFYRKAYESQLRSGSSHVVRGASYRLTVVTP